MQIQAVQAQDTQAIGALMRRVVTTSLGLAPQELAGVLENVEHNLYWAQAYPDLAVHLKCTDGSRIVGVVLIKHFWNLCSLFVDPGAQRRGIGRALLSQAIRRSASRNTVGYVRVNAASGAVPFYQVLNFRVMENQPRWGTSVPMRLPLD